MKKLIIINLKIKNNIFKYNKKIQIMIIKFKLMNSYRINHRLLIKKLKIYR